MRRLLISLLLASAAATPALAEPGEHRHHDNNSSEQHQPRSERPQRSESSGRQNSNENGGGERQNFTRSQGFQQNGQQAIQQQDPSQSQAFRAERQRMQAAEAFNGDGDSREDRRTVRRNRQFNGGGQQVTDESLRQSDHPLPRVLRTRDRSQVVTDIPRRGTQPPLRVDNHRRDRVSWSTNWRHDGRYDWRNWRHRHRSIFHLGFYYDPFGWGYQPFSIGWRLWPNYYSSNYWINDPWEYRLPYAPPGTRWVRYYNDALLVDTFTGEVVDVIRDFFW